MNQVNQKVKVGKKYAIYLPKKVIVKLGIKEGDILLLDIDENNNLILKRIEKIHRKSKYWSKITPEEVEKAGEKISRKILE